MVYARVKPNINKLSHSYKWNKINFFWELMSWKIYINYQHFYTLQEWLKSQVNFSHISCQYIAWGYFQKSLWKFLVFALTHPPLLKFWQRSRPERHKTLTSSHLISSHFYAIYSFLKKETEVFCMYFDWHQ